jgi:hypothetical protein
MRQGGRGWSAPASCHKPSARWHRTHAAVGFRSTLDWSQAHLTEAAQRGVIILNAVVVAEIALRFSGVEGIHAAIPSMAIC